MSVSIAVLVFFACLITTLASSEVLVRGLSVLGTKLKLTEGFLGLLTALGADAPEIAAAKRPSELGLPYGSWTFVVMITLC